MLLITLKITHSDCYKQPLTKARQLTLMFATVNFLRINSVNLKILVGISPLNFWKSNYIMSICITSNKRQGLQGQRLELMSFHSKYTSLKITL